MTEQDQAKGTTSEDAVVLERELDASRDIVWQAWTDPEHFARWYGPDGFTVPHCTMELRVGGSIRICMRHPQYGDMWSAGVFDEIDPPARLVYREYMTDPDGNKVSPPHPDWPEEALVTLLFDEIGNGRTKMTVTWAVPAQLATEMGALAGWEQAFAKLAAYVARGESTK